MPVDGVMAGREGEAAPSLAGICTAFCPPAELALRRRERLLHRLEVGPGLVPVKEYSRPAAGQAGPDRRAVRSPTTLTACCRYLATQVLGPRLEGAAPAQLAELYDFLFDRLRAVRADLAVQEVTGEPALGILAVCVRFHLLFGHLLAGHASFSAHLNSSHQLECVKSCLLVPGVPPSCPALTAMQCCYLLSNCDSPSALAWATSLHERPTQLAGCLALARAFTEGNWVRYYRLLAPLPLFLLLASLRPARLLLQRAVRASCAGYRAPNVRVGVELVGRQLLVPPGPLAAWLTECGVKVEGGRVWWGHRTKVEVGPEPDGPGHAHLVTARLKTEGDRLVPGLLGDTDENHNNSLNTCTEKVYRADV